MLCPDVVNFPAPKTVCSSNKNDSLESIVKTVQMNSFYKSLVITCPDEIQTPKSIEDLLTEDSDYYQITNCSLTEFVEPVFIENFVKKGNLYCLSSNRDCIVENCAAITPNGTLTLHILDFIYQTLGLEGTKRPHHYYEIKIDLKNLKNNEKFKRSLAKLEVFNFYISWEPHEDGICPSSLAKYFHDRNINVATKSLVLKNITPDIKEVPSIRDVDADEMVEWVGMLAIEGNLYEEESYISTYCVPESELSLNTNRISVLIVKGFLTPQSIVNVCKSVHDLAMTSSIENYWTSVSIQSQEDSLWQWTPSSPKMFQAHDSSYNAFFSKECIVTYSIGQIKYS